jgi:hypothetical protein
MLDADDGEGGSADGDARSGSGDDEDDDDDRGAWHMAEAGNEELLKSVLQKVSRCEGWEAAKRPVLTPPVCLACMLRPDCCCCPPYWRSACEDNGGRWRKG